MVKKRKIKTLSSEEEQELNQAVKEGTEEGVLRDIKETGRRRQEKIRKGKLEL